MRDYLAATHPKAVVEFDARCEDHGNFQIYEQAPGCQFLDEHNLCTLHGIGLKPAECFWWPYHVYANKHDELEVRVSSGCCNAFQFHEPSSGYADMVVNEAREIGYDVLRAFREAFPGRCPSLLVQQIEVAAPPAELNRLPA